MPVAHRLGDRDDVGHHPLLLEPPEPAAEAAVARLHLVGDGQAAVAAHRGVDGGQVAVGKGDAARVAEEGLGDERGGRVAVCGEGVDDGNGGSRRVIASWAQSGQFWPLCAPSW